MPPEFSRLYIYTHIYLCVYVCVAFAYGMCVSVSSYKDYMGTCKGMSSYDLEDPGGFLEEGCQ